METTKTTGGLLFEEEDVFTAEKYLRDLARGRDPFGGADLSDDHPLQEPALSKALELSADLLAAWQENGGFNRIRPSRTRPFELSLSDRKKIDISERPIGVTTLARNITKALPYDMQAVRYTSISNWLLAIGALGWEVQEDGKRKRYPTAMGEELGIRTVTRTAADGTQYRKNVYEPRAQQFVIDNLDGIMSPPFEEAAREKL